MFFKIAFIIMLIPACVGFWKIVEDIYKYLEKESDNDSNK